MSFHVEKEVTTRKSHPCLWCGESISVGSPALGARGANTDGLYHWHMHPECAAAYKRCPCMEGEELIPEAYHLRGKDCNYADN